MSQRLEAAKAQLDNLYQQQAAAKEEVGKPFLYEEELRSKNARLVELDTLLNIDGKGQAHTESAVANSTRPSVCLLYTSMALVVALMPCPAQHTAAKITTEKDCTIKSKTARMFT